MKEKILTQLKTKFSGVSEKVLGIIADKISAKVTKDEEIEGAIGDFEKLIPVKDFADIIQKEGDKRATDAVKTHETSLKEKYDFVEKKKEDQDPPTPTGDDKDDKYDLLSKQINELKQSLEQKNKQDQQAALKSQAVAKLKEKKVPEVFLNGKVIEKEEDIDTIVAEAEENFKAVKQGMINEGLVADVPKGGQGDSSLSTDTEAYLNNRKGEKENSTALSGKSLD